MQQSREGKSGTNYNQQVSVVVRLIAIDSAMGFSPM